MCFAVRWVTSAAFAVIVSATSVGALGAPDERETISSERREAARRSFERGERVFEAGDFVQAAKSFDEAYRALPHHAPLWNAARSWERAGEHARAANAYARYLREAPEDAPDRDAATQALAALAEKLGRIEVHAAGIDAVRIDDELLEGTSIYVHPGMHVIEGQTARAKIRRTEMVEAGSVRSVALVEELPAAESPPAPRNPERTPSKVVEPLRPMAKPVIPVNASRGWFGPAALVAGGATMVVSSFVVWSGIDTLTARTRFDAEPTQSRLAAGKNKQLRTNALLGTAIGLGAVTATFTSLWLWNRPNGKTTGVTVLPPVAGMPLELSIAGTF